MPLVSQEQIAFEMGVDLKDIPEHYKKKQPTLDKLSLDTQEKIAKRWGIKIEALPDYIKEKYPAKKAKSNNKENKRKESADPILVFKWIIFIAIIVFLIWLFHDGFGPSCKKIKSGPNAGFNECDLPQADYGGPFTW